MCTAITYQTKDHYFGRNLDLECSLNEAVTVTPRNFAFPFRKTGTMARHYALIGMAHIAENFPLYYDATNEKGLSVAGLNFPGNAVYAPYQEGKDNIAPFELIPWILGQCATVAEAERLLRKTNLWNEPFNEKLPATPLHWLIADKNRAITLEAVENGLKIYENPMGVLTNNPPFDCQLFHLNHYMGLTAKDPINTFAPGLELTPYSRGMGAIGMPGDFSSMSRFVRAAFVKLNSVSATSEAESVSQFFHILRSVQMPRGSVCLERNVYEITLYSSCCNTDRGIYYYSTYGNCRLCAVDLHRENLDATALAVYPLIQEWTVTYQNERRSAKQENSSTGS